MSSDAKLSLDALSSPSPLPPPHSASTSSSSPSLHAQSSQRSGHAFTASNGNVQPHTRFDGGDRNGFGRSEPWRQSDDADDEDASILNDVESFDGNHNHGDGGDDDENSDSGKYLEAAEISVHSERRRSDDREEGFDEPRGLFGSMHRDHQHDEPQYSNIHSDDSDMQHAHYYERECDENNEHAFEASVRVFKFIVPV